MSSDGHVIRVPFTLHPIFKNRVIKKSKNRFITSVLLTRNGLINECSRGVRSKFTVDEVLKGLHTPPLLSLFFGHNGICDGIKCPVGKF